MAESQTYRCERLGKFAKLICSVAILLPIAQAVWAALPPGWSDADIGSPGLAGPASYTNGNWTVSGGGADIWDVADQFNYAYTTMSGDGTIIARMSGQQNTDPGG